MKNMLLIPLLFMGIQMTLKAQNNALNKGQTVDYINKLYKVAYQYKETKIDTVILDGKVLNVFLSTGKNYRSDISKSDSLVVSKENAGYHIRYKSSPNTAEILWAIQIEEDARRLKNALQHLIAILTAEKSEDPFAE